jgi:hypothetical protein
VQYATTIQALEIDHSKVASIFLIVSRRRRTFAFAVSISATLTSRSTSDKSSRALPFPFTSRSGLGFGREPDARGGGAPTYAEPKGTLFSSFRKMWIWSTYLRRGLNRPLSPHPSSSSSSRARAQPSSSQPVYASQSAKSRPKSTPASLAYTHRTSVDHLAACKVSAFEKPCIDRTSSKS